MEYVRNPNQHIIRGIAVAGLIVRNNRLCNTNSFCKLLLCQPLPFPQFLQPLSKVHS